MLTSDLPQIAQIEAVASWLTTLGPEDLDRMSCLPHWTVRDLVVHLGLSLASAEAVTVADIEPDDADPADVLTTADYLSLATDLGDRIAAAAIERSHEVEDPREFLLQQQARGLQQLQAWGSRDRLLKVRGRLMPLSAYLDARLVETVVHTMDLAVSVPELRPPHLFRSGLDRVVVVLREALAARAPDPVAAVAAASELQGPEFIAVAAGRRAGDLDEALAAALPLV